MKIGNLGPETSVPVSQGPWSSISITSFWALREAHSTTDGHGLGRARNSRVNARRVMPLHYSRLLPGSCSSAAILPALT
jgi:hypothetical protein